MVEMTVKSSSGGAIEEGDYQLTVENTEVIWLDPDNNWEEVDDPFDPEANVDDPTGKYVVTFQLEDDDFTLDGSWWLNNFDLSPDSGFGQLMERWGVIEDFDSQEDETVELNDIFAEGRTFKARIREDPNSDYHEIDEVTMAGHDDDDFEDDQQWGETLQPVDDSGDAGTAGGESEEDAADLEGEVYEILADLDDPSEGELTSRLAQSNGKLVPQMKEMLDDGSLEVNDGVVEIA